MRSKNFIFLFLIIFGFTVNLLAQEDGERILYYQMEPLDDSLFIKIQDEMFIDPPDPKAEIIVDLRDPNNQTLTIKSTLYPLLAFTPETRAKIVAYPFKIDLQTNITYSSVFTSVVNKMKFKKILAPPTKTQISSSLQYINPYLELFGGERFGIPLKKDIGLSFGLGTPYSGPLETGFIEANFHLLGFRVGAFSNIDAFTTFREVNNFNNLYAAQGIQVGYVIPFGNFFEFSYQKVTKEFSPEKINKLRENGIPELNYYPKIMQGSYVNWEFRYPVRVFGATRGKFFVAKYLNEWHFGYTGRELSLAGSTFDLRIDAMPSSPDRNPQYVLDITVQKILESFGFSAFSLGPAAIFSRTSSGGFGIISVFLNMRIKVGTSL
ncbi:hypothetical protein BMS3Abin04_00672 [bacterium BMS3Abin04]|nr:hypothetical protein BMS3Abin04_00672 [bacterium BMS3Abin04]